MVDTLLRGHHRFIDRKPVDERAFLRQLAGRHQSPGALYIGCADSRVVPELLTSSAPGDLFVVRNVANLAPPLAHADSSVGAAIEYAVTHLHVPHIIVCGHYGCGGIKGVVDAFGGLDDCPSLVEWLQTARPAVERARASAPVDTDALWRRAVEENVLEQLGHLTSFPAVERALEADAIALHGWVYDLHTLALHVYEPSLRRFVHASAMLAG